MYGLGKERSALWLSVLDAYQGGPSGLANDLYGEPNGEYAIACHKLLGRKPETQYDPVSDAWKAVAVDNYLQSIHRERSKPENLGQIDYTRGVVKVSPTEEARRSRVMLESQHTVFTRLHMRDVHSELKRCGRSEASSGERHGVMQLQPAKRARRSQADAREAPVFQGEHRTSERLSESSIMRHTESSMRHEHGRSKTVMAAASLATLVP
ncbi:hypothetical protein C8R47DRAFT_1200947 [Mycena vitilis]|nr:hypothetical protein C8R47DRAFT_1200947 [Mycena vitilis]